MDGCTGPIATTMKNATIGILLLATIGFGYMTALHYLRLPLGVPGKTATILRRDLVLPIIATGDVAPYLRVEIKAEASGEVIAILAKPGDRVQKGDLIIKLEPDEEKRSVQRAELDLAIAQARLADSKDLLDLAKGPDVDAAQASVDQADAQVEQAQYDHEHVMKFADPSPQEVQRVKTTLRSQQAQLATAKANLAKAQLAISRAGHAVTQAEAAVATAKFNLADAEKRLAKTDIVAPIDGTRLVEGNDHWG